MQKAIAFAALVVGLVLLYLGYQESQSVGSQLSEAFSGSPSDRSTWLYLGGAAATAFGAFRLLAGRG